MGNYFSDRTILCFSQGLGTVAEVLSSVLIHAFPTCATPPSLAWRRKSRRYQFVGVVQAVVFVSAARVHA